MRNQLSESQLGCPGSFDKRQEDRDKRIITALVTASEKEQADKDLKKDLEERRKSELESSAVAAGAEVEDSTQDKDYNVGRLRQNKKRKTERKKDFLLHFNAQLIKSLHNSNQVFFLRILPVC